MTIIGVVGLLGAGKTLTLTWLAYNAHKYDKYRIVSNYDLKFTHDTVDYLDDMDIEGSKQPGMMALDELWYDLDSRCSQKRKAKFLSRILLQSRKKNFHVAYTSQAMNQMDRRIRNMTSLVLAPTYSKETGKCLVRFFKNSTTLIECRNPVSFDAEPIFKLYDTNEIIEGLGDLDKVIR